MFCSSGSLGPGWVLAGTSGLGAGGLGPLLQDRTGGGAAPELSALPCQVLPSKSSQSGTPPAAQACGCNSWAPPVGQGTAKGSKQLRCGVLGHSGCKWRGLGSMAGGHGEPEGLRNPRGPPCTQGLGVGCFLHSLHHLTGCRGPQTQVRMGWYVGDSKP